MEVQEANLNQICRCCRESNNEMVSIFSAVQPESTYPRIDEMLMAIAPLTVKEEDGLPSVLCTICVDKVQSAYQLRQQLIRSEAEFKGAIKEEKIDSDNDVDHSHAEIMGNILRDILDEQADISDDSIEQVEDIQIEPEEDTEENKNDTEENENDPEESENDTQEDENNTRQKSKKSLLKCKHCDNIYSSSKSLKTHIQRYHEKCKKFECKICLKVFGRVDHVKRHIYTHVKEKPLNCNKCNRGFARLENLNTHAGICDGRREYSCKICNKGFLNERSLEVHKKMHDEDDSKRHLVLTLKDLDSIKKYYRIVQGDDDGKSSESSEDDNDDEEEEEEEENNEEDEENSDNEMNNERLEQLENSLHQQRKGEGDDFVSYVETNESPEKVSSGNANQKVSLVESMIQIQVKEDPDFDPTIEEVSDPSDTDYNPHQKRHSTKRKKSSSSTGKRGRPRNSSPSHEQSSSDLNQELNSANLSKEFTCPLCSETFKRITLLESHGKECHENDKILICTQCNQSFSRVYALNQHMKFHKSNALQICSICSSSFYKKEDLLSHSRIHNEYNVETACHDCCKVFLTLDELKQHMMQEKHFGKVLADERKIKKRFECEKCTKRFTTEKVLMAHMTKHTGDKNYVCPKCSKPFLSKSNLTEHMKFHDKIKKFLCSECGMSFIRNDYLVIHMRRHRGEKPFKCKFCGKGFPRVTDLTVHERYHTGEKTHLCVICGRGFNRAYNLTVHMRTHTGEKPYKCTYCDSAFAQCNDLKAHIRRHTGERFHCDMCPETFLMGYALKQHKRTVHGLNIVSNIRRLNPPEQQNPDEPEPVVMALPKPIVPRSTTGTSVLHSNIISIEEAEQSFT